MPLLWKSNGAARRLYRVDVEDTDGIATVVCTEGYSNGSEESWVRGSRARAVAVERLGEVPGDVAEAIGRVGDDLLAWIGIAGKLLARTPVSRSACVAVAALMRFGLGEISPRHPQRLLFVQNYSAGMGMLAALHDELEALDEMSDLLDGEVQGRADDDPILLYVRHARVLMAKTRERLVPGEAATRELIEAGLARLAIMRPDNEAAELMARLGKAYHDLFHLTADPNTLADSLRFTYRALQGVAGNYPRRGRMLRSAVEVLRHRYEDLGEDSVLAEIARLGRDIMHWHAALGQPHEDAAVALGVVGVLLRERYQEFGDAAALEDAVCFVRAAAVAATDHSDKVFHLADLSALLYFSYERSGDEATHSEAVATGRAALGYADGGPDAIRALNNLASNLMARNSRTGDSRAVAEAIELLEQAISMTPSDSPELVDRLNNLSGALHAEFLRTGDSALLDRAVELGRRAVTAATAAGHRGRFGMLSELGVRLKARHTGYGDVADIDEAARCAREVVAEMPNTDPDRPGLVAKSIMAIWNLYRAAPRRPELLDEMINLARAELRHLPAKHHALPELWTALASGLDSRYLDYGDIPAAHEARLLLLKAASAGGLPFNRISRYRLAAGLSRMLGDWPGAADALTDAIELLPMTASRRLNRADQERQLSQLDGVVQEACACALQAGDPELAVTLLEHGRGILFAQALENRDDLGELRDTHPNLAERLEAVRDRLADELDLDNQHAQADLWDRLVSDVRGLSGFERFMLPPSVGELQAAAELGPVVLFSISRIRSDALILTPEGVDVVPLPQATPDVVRKRAVEFTAAVHHPPADLNSQARRNVADTLFWLWEEITGPVLARLGLGSGSSEDWPHVWWCPTGPLSFLPLHAAGNDTDAVMDRVISSYTPSVRALQYARRPGSRVRDARALVVAMSTTGGVEGLPGVSREVETLAARVSVTRLTETTADRERVLRELPTHPWVHFACHGESDPDNPSASHLLLRDHAAAPLTVVDVSRLRLEIADLAYLSACSTARVGATLTDEAIHLASAFQLAGYRHVVATLWPISDRHAVSIAEEVYDRVVAHGTASTAQAVHEATRRLRHRRREFPEMWAAHIHTGA